MVQFSAVVGILLFAGMFAAIWQLPPQGARGQWTPIVVLGLIGLSYLLTAPTSEALFDAVRVNSAYLLSHLCVLTALALSSLYWLHYLSADPPTRRRALAMRLGYGGVAVTLPVLFAASPQRPHGVGFGCEFAGSPGMRIYWVLQSVMVIYALSPLARAAFRAYRQEKSWRRNLLVMLSGLTMVFIAYELWVILVVALWPTMPPPWAQTATTLLQVTVGVLLVAGAFGPVVSGAFHNTRLALNYLERLAPLHHWLMQRYPHIRFRARTSLRLETRVTEMLIEISDGLRLLQRDEPALAAALRLDHNTIRTMGYDRDHHAAYELAAAATFRSRNPGPTLPTRVLPAHVTPVSGQAR
ncbi:DUF6545 domain-containing protein [Nocardia sp. NPDC056000]|uniref:DUF6545 domain-containing protein n=1 Tax=Nocardia sp. NPDC056000 TaxID=3345674 RepID=UPI0035D9AC09